MRNVKETKHPPIREEFFYGPVVGYRMIGNIQKDRGKYRFIFKVRVKNLDQEIQQQRTGFKNKEDAKKARNVIISQLESGQFRLEYNYKFYDVCVFFLYHHLLEVKDASYNTFMSFRNIIENYLNVWHNLPFKSIGPKEVEDLLNSRTYSNAIWRMMKSALYSLYACAMENGLIDYNPCIYPFKNDRYRKAQDFESKVVKKTRPIYTDEQMRRLLFACRKQCDEMFMPLVLMVSTGMRVSEACSVHYKDIDFSKQTVYVHSQIGRKVKSKEEDYGIALNQEIRTKTKTSVRKIPIPDFVVDEIIVRRKQYERLKEEMGDSFHDGDYICIRKDGQPVNRYIVGRRIKELMEEEGLPPIHIHDLRGSYASFLNICDELYDDYDYSKITVKSVSSMLGHGRIATSQKYYIRNEIAAVDCVNALEKVWSSLKSDNILLEIADQCGVLEEIWDVLSH